MSFSAAASGTQKTLAIRASQKFQGHRSWVFGMVHLLGRQRIMTCSDDGSLRVWNLKTGEQIGDAWRDGQKSQIAVYAIALTLDGKKVVCGCGDGTVKLWDINTGKFIAKWTVQTRYIKSLCWNRDYTRVVSTSIDGIAKVLDVESGMIVLSIETGLSGIPAVIYSPDMTMIATGGDTEELKEFIKLWDANTGKLITKLKGHTEQVYCLAWTADGSMLVSGSLDSSIRTWNTTTWQQIHVLTGHTNTVRGIVISPNGPILASASFDNTARLWNLENGLPIGSPLEHPDGVQCVSFSTDGKLLATGCQDHNAYSWDISGILEEAGSDKLLIDADAKRRPGHRRRDVHRIPPRFFDDAPRPSHPSRTYHISPSSARQNNITGHPPSHDMPSRPSILEWARSMSFRLPHRRDNVGIQSQARLPAIVDVPVAKGGYRNYTAREALKKREKEREKARNAKNAQNTQNATNVSAGSSRPAQSSATQQSGGVLSQVPPEVHATVTTLSAENPIAATPEATTPVSLPDAVIPRAGRWTRFWLFLGCVSAQYTDDHN